MNQEVIATKQDTIPVHIALIIINNRMPFTKGHNLWNHPNVLKNQFKKGDNTRLGKKVSQGVRLRMSKRMAENPLRYWLGKKLPEAMKRRMVEARMANDSYKISKERRQLLGEILKPYWFKKGKEHPNWIDGNRSSLKNRFATKEHRVWREAIFERDNYTCQFCKNIGGYLQADHIKMYSKYPKLAWELSNGRTLCKECHRWKTSIDMRIWNGRVLQLNHI